jgi:hypothetical protein
MHRSLRLIVAAFVLLAVAAGTALAARQPSTDHGRAPLAASPAGSPATDGAEEADEPMTADAAEALVERLAAAGLETDSATLLALAADHGVGGAVRLLGWAQETGRSVDEIAAMRDDGMGWGRIAKELGVHPGIGHWMRGDHGSDQADEADDAGALGDGEPVALPDQARGHGRSGAPGQATRP